jgi:triacylglycerol lipase
MTTFPIVLAHGIARFDILAEILRSKLEIPETIPGDQTQYFKGIKSHLEAHGFTVSHPNQSFAGSVDLRAEELGDRINEVLSSSGSAKVHIIAHSMGGLDARHMIVDKGMAERVATLTTIGSPHHGSPVADQLVIQGGSLLLQVLDKVIDVHGVADLTTSACEHFNRRAEDDEARNPILYQTYSASENLNLVFAPLIPSWIIVRDREGRNDGLVSVRSQEWARELIASDGARKAIVQRTFPFPADHLNEVGWWDPEEVINPLFGGGSVVKQAADYEQRIRDLYLEIAQGLP